MIAAYAAAAFALCAAAGIALAGAIRIADPFDDGPRPGKPPLALLMTGAAALGASLAALGSPPLQLLLPAALCIPLAAIWCTDVRYGIVPDAFTLVPLAGMLVFAIASHRWFIVGSALVPFVPFALAAAASRGRGMGWGDVKLAALGGAVLGAETATLFFAAGCLAAVAVTYARGRRNEPIAFAPYLVLAIAAALPLKAVA